MISVQGAARRGNAARVLLNGAGVVGNAKCAPPPTRPKSHSTPALPAASALCTLITIGSGP